MLYLHSYGNTIDNVKVKEVWNEYEKVRIRATYKSDIEMQKKISIC